jgi:hypothetical protein
MNIRAGLLMAALLPALPAAAESEKLHPYLSRKHMFWVGAYYQEAEAEMRESVDPLPQIAVNLGHLGVDDTDTTWYVEYRGRFWDRWGIVASAQNFSSQGTLINGREFNFDRVTFPVGARLHSELDVDTSVFDFVYEAYQSDRAEFAVGLGIHAFEFDARITGTVNLGDGPFGREAERSVGASDLLAPLPNIRMSGFYAFSSRWSVGGSIGWLSANYDEWDGSFVYLNARMHLLVTERLGVGVGYQFTDVDVTRERRRQESEYDIEFSGPTLHVTFGF